MRTTLFLTASAAAIGTALTISSPASAQVACDLNGVAGVPVGTLSTDSLQCGNAAASIGPSTDTTFVGADIRFGGNSVTIVGSNAVGDTGSIFAFAPYVRPADIGATAIGSYSFASGLGSVAVGDQATVGLVTFGGGGVTGITAANDGTAIGSHARVTAVDGTAIGWNSAVTAAQATSVGSLSQATAANATALGFISSATGAGATAIGAGALGSNIGSVALGRSAVSGGTRSVALGDSSTASASNSIAIGFFSNASIANAIAIGNGAIANNTSNVAIGSGASTAGFANSVALGAGSVNTAANQLAIGGRTISGVNAGVAGTDAVNVNQLNAATASISGDITALEAMDVILADRIHDVDDHARSGTALAIAMGGAAFLPDKKYNVSGNMGVYRGAWAGAINFNALVSPDIALNAGVGAGFNKSGKLGGRVGFTFGW